VIATEVEHHRVLKVNCPRLYDRPDFQEWFHRVQAEGGLATWHVSGHPLNEWSDVFLVVDSLECGDVHGNGDDESEWWAELIEVLNTHGFVYGVVWLTNCPEREEEDE
jgi:hypothetical protein